MCSGFGCTAVMATFSLSQAVMARVVSGDASFVDSRVSSCSSDNCLLKFIKTYESLPELWNRSDPNYLNKFKKRAALEKLLVIYWGIRPQARIRDVTRKLNFLRFKYRRELNKIKSSMSSECEEDEIYRPNSWVVKALKFLDVSESTASSTPNSQEDVSI